MRIESKGAIMKSRKEKTGRADFLIEIRYTEHSSWQGTVKWLDSQKEICFRSALELLKILDSAEKAAVLHDAAVATEEGRNLV